MMMNTELILNILQEIKLPRAMKKQAQRDIIAGIDPFNKPRTNFKCAFYKHDKKITVDDGKSVCPRCFTVFEETKHIYTNNNTNINDDELLQTKTKEMTKQ